MPIRLRRTGVGLIALGVLLAGCGGDADTAEDAATAADTSDTADAGEGSESANGDDDGADDAAPDDAESDPEDAAAADPAGSEDAAATDTDDADDLDTEVADGTAQVLVQFRGEQIVVSAADPDFSCVTMGGTEMVAFGILDDAGNDISIAYEGDSVDATATLADGSNWNQTEGGVLNVLEGPDGAVRMSIQLTETTTGESEPMDVRLTC